MQEIISMPENKVQELKSWKLERRQKTVALFAFDKNIYNRTRGFRYYHCLLAANYRS